MWGSDRDGDGMGIGLGRGWRRGGGCTCVDLPSQNAATRQGTRLAALGRRITHFRANNKKVRTTATTTTSVIIYLDSPASAVRDLVVQQSRLRPRIALSPGSGTWSKARETCTQPSWLVTRHNQTYAVDVCDFFPGQSAASQVATNHHHHNLPGLL